jgi:hypothetical protein
MAFEPRVQTTEVLSAQAKIGVSRSYDLFYRYIKDPLAELHIADFNLLATNPIFREVQTLSGFRFAVEALAGKIIPNRVEPFFLAHRLEELLVQNDICARINPPVRREQTYGIVGAYPEANELRNANMFSYNLPVLADFRPGDSLVIMPKVGQETTIDIKGINQSERIIQMASGDLKAEEIYGKQIALLSRAGKVVLDFRNPLTKFTFKSPNDPHEWRRRNVLQEISKQAKAKIDLHFQSRYVEVTDIKEHLQVRIGYQSDGLVNMVELYDQTTNPKKSRRTKYIFGNGYGLVQIPDSAEQSISLEEEATVLAFVSKTFFS